MEELLLRIENWLAVKYEGNRQPDQQTIGSYTFDPSKQLLTGKTTLVTRLSHKETKLLNV